MTRWQDVADDLRTAILNGTYPPDSTIPKEEQLEARYDCSRTMIRRAVAQLTKEGLLRPVRKGGTYVQQHPARQRLTLDTGAYRDELGYFFAAATQPLRPLQPPTVTEGPCPPDLVALLGLETGASVVIRDRVMGDPGAGRAVQLATSYLPADLAAGTVLAEADTGPGGIYDRMEQDLGWGVLEWAGAISARAATPEETSLLGLAPGVPVLCVTRTTTATAGPTAGRVVEVNVTRRDASRFEVGYPIVRE
ncbi:MULTISPECIES: GntR family transcriptional regulator [Streptosporangium]|uniref:GntR family transcriptional regulator n=1 Tax=Streptosporangium brasiliense TaxID=47480 RepID=A0ABT9RE06_9ACTN|nr:GntR family transcriptional regulator [Streptosporangium brasiliense]MDP9866630.1 GntR family transcriptional regulator [Streptosporangium brasiliense]